jgi:transposase
MMGEHRVGQEALFYEFSFERHVPVDHLLRSIDRFVDLSGVRAHLRPFYSEIGRPSIDPELMIRMLLVGYCFGIRSERRLCEEVHLNLAYRWFCRLGLEGDVPDHSTFSKNRHGRFRDCDLLRKLFETTVRRCMAEGLVGGEGFAADASLIRADANKQRSAEGSEEVDCGDPPLGQGVSRHTGRCCLGRCQRGQAEVHLEVRSCCAMDRSAQGACLLRLRRQLPDRPRPRHHRRCRAEPRDPAQAEVGAARTMIDRIQDQFGLYPERVAADSAYGSAEMLGWLVHERGIEPHIPVFDKSQRSDGTFSRDDFAYDHKRNCYICPAGKQLRQRQKVYRVPRPLVDEDGMMRYRASKLDCERCSLKPQCCPNAPARKIPRSIHEGARDMARDIADTDAYVTSRRERKKVEMLFAHLKRILKLDRLRLRGPNGARDEFHLAATAQNLRKLAKLIPTPEPIPA